MILDEKEIQRWIKQGRKLIASDGQPVKTKHNELSYLELIAALLAKIHAKPYPVPQKMEMPPINVQPPQVIVQPPEVVVHAPTASAVPPQPKQIRKWKFVLEKDISGHTTEITATALE